MLPRQWKRRVEKDTTQLWRGRVQLLFLILNLWIGLTFVIFVRRWEGLWTPWNPSRPAGVEGWLPIAGMMNTRYLLETGSIPAIHPAAMVLLLVFVLLSFVFRKAFCSWICPVGTVSEWLWKLGRQTFHRSFELPKWLEIALKTIKYALFLAFFYAVSRMDAASVEAFLASPYGLMADVKMLNFFRFLSAGAALAIGTLIIGSIFVPNLWCRHLCPYGALMGTVALASPSRIRREPASCIDCRKCAKACPSRLPVDQLVQIRSAECTGCMECVSICPAEGALAMTFAGRNRTVTGQRLAWVIAGVFTIVYMGARLTGHWESPIPDDMYRELVPLSRELDHPR